MYNTCKTTVKPVQHHRKTIVRLLQNLKIENAYISRT